MRIFALCLVAALAAGCSDSPTAANRLPDARLPTLAGKVGPSLAACSGAKCLTVLVAPWCGVCHAVAPNIVELRAWLKKNGVESRVVVGMTDDAGSIREFAKLFGPDALLDAEQSVRARGVPLFLVTDKEGKVLKALNGFPRGASGPRELAGLLGLL